MKKSAKDLRLAAGEIEILEILWRNKWSIRDYRG